MPLCAMLHFTSIPCTCSSCHVSEPPKQELLLCFLAMFREILKIHFAILENFSNFAKTKWNNGQKYTNHHHSCIAMCRLHKQPQHSTFRADRRRDRSQPRGRTGACEVLDEIYRQAPSARPICSPSAIPSTYPYAPRYSLRPDWKGLPLFYWEEIVVA